MLGFVPGKCWPQDGPPSLEALSLVYLAWLYLTCDLESWVWGGNSLQLPGESFHNLAMEPLSPARQGITADRPQQDGDQREDGQPARQGRSVGTLGVFYGSLESGLSWENRSRAEEGGLTSSYIPLSTCSRWGLGPTWGLGGEEPRGSQTWSQPCSLAPSHQVPPDEGVLTCRGCSVDAAIRIAILSLHHMCEDEERGERQGAGHPVLGKGLAMSFLGTKPHSYPRICPPDLALGLPSQGKASRV